MKKISKKELMQIKGGSISVGTAFGIGAGIVFLIGVIDGFVRPLKCH